MPRVLIVDDHPVVREGIGRVLETAADDVVLGFAGTAAEALERLSGTQWDMAFLDISLPDMDGTLLLERLRQRHPALPVVVVSMHPAEQLSRRAFEAGAIAYVPKDSPPHELVRAARAALAGVPYRRADPPEQRTRLPHDTLSEREFQVLGMIGSGRTLADIAAELSLSKKTVSTYRLRILEKLGLRTTPEIIRYAIAHRLIPWQPM